MKPLLRGLSKLPFLAYIKLHEHTWKPTLNYLTFHHHSSILVIVFSAFDQKDNRRSYNYVRSLAGLPVDFLFLSDPFGFRGSYYLREYGDSLPELITERVINQKIEGGGYSSIISLGSSKGGTAALYFGLKLRVSHILIGACQYRIGSYLASYPEIYYGMTGGPIDSQTTAVLDGIMPQMLKDSNPVATEIHLIHSKFEPTYDRDTKYLIEDLNRYGYNWTEIECGFKEHNQVGIYFSPYARKFITDLIKKTK